MYEFVGAAVARSFMVEGEFNQVSTWSAALGTFIMQCVAWYTGENPEVYALALIKFCIAWLVAGGILGVLVAALSFFRFRKDWNPRTRAWPSGPRLPAVFLALREVVSGLFSMFYPLRQQTLDMIQFGIGYEYFGASIFALFVVLTIGYMVLDQQEAVAAAARPKKAKKN
eukprot:jgi/Hompol1/1928/HPOL_005803-RA